MAHDAQYVESLNRVDSIKWLYNNLCAPIEKTVSEHIGREWSIHSAKDLSELACHHCAIVSDHSLHLTLRDRDYIPPPGDSVTQEELDEMPDPAMYKADKFLTFLREKLMPYLHDQYRIDPEETVLAGDSNSGLFALYTLFHQPTLFKRYIQSSRQQRAGDYEPYSQSCHPC
jgi:predicted alpha/beta superfamily hydrolase